ncbi:MAG: hypothetical protein ACPGNR_12680 [Paracoccaceae bacterium]
MPKPNPYISHYKAFEDFVKKNAGVSMSIEELNKWRRADHIDWDDYTAQDLASWWLNDDFHISGIGCESKDIADIMYWLTRNDDYDFMQLVQKNWSGCDNFHDLTEYFREKFEEYYVKGGDIKNAICVNDRNWWDALPNRFFVYRGCEADRIEGLSWSIDRKVAEIFAKGHRGLKLQNPVIARAKINKSDVWFATNEREEQEIVWDAFEPRIKIFKAKR